MGVSTKRRSFSLLLEERSFLSLFFFSVASLFSFVIVVDLSYSKGAREDGFSLPDGEFLLPIIRWVIYTFISFFRANQSIFVRNFFRFVFFYYDFFSSVVECWVASLAYSVRMIVHQQICLSSSIW